VFARHGDVRAAAQPVSLQEEDGQRDQQQDKAIGRRFVLVKPALDGVENLGRQKWDPAPEDQRISEVGQALNHHQQDGIGHSGAHEGPEDSPEEGPTIRPERLRCLFKGDVH
jgi:hypothetical protein